MLWFWLRVICGWFIAVVGTSGLLGFCVGDVLMWVWGLNCVDFLVWFGLGVCGGLIVGVSAVAVVLGFRC